jgi:DNA-directed RNA polymerase specialized sigma24 family protein
MYFPSTHWSLLARANVNGETEAHSALGELCRRYWAPLHQFIRARGYSDAEAEDLTQEFLVHLLEHSALRKPDPLRGRFRSFLLGALANFLSHERERRFAQKRGGQHTHVGIELLQESASSSAASIPDAEAAVFDRAWALTVLRAALQRVEQDYIASGKTALFGILRGFLPGGSNPPSYGEAAAQAGMSVAAFNSEVHRLRRQFREFVCAEVMATVSAPHEMDEEIAHLYRVLMDRGTDFPAGAES